MVLNGRTIPVVRRGLTRSDRWGSLKARWGIGRMAYTVLPGLYAAGTPTSESAERSGFRIVWGPVRAEDIPAWLASGRVKVRAMGEVTFTLRERMVVAPVELVHSWPFVLAAFFLGSLSRPSPPRARYSALSGLLSPRYSFAFLLSPRSVLF